jgi:hypothetical protein
MVALVATLIISGAVVQLVGAGKGAFRREPEISDRQQNIRMAMAMINQDIQGAGMGMPSFTQVFTDNLNNLGPQVPTATSGTKTDELEVISSTACPAVNVCSSPGVNIDTSEVLPACYDLPNVVGLWDSTHFALGFAFVRSGSPSCNGSHLNMPPGQSALNPSGGPGFNPTTMGLVSVMRYRIQLDTDGTPNLWRSAYGGYDRNGQSTWQMVARGIEDLQVQYRNRTGWRTTPGNLAWANPASPTAADYDKVIRQVRVTLSGRSLAANLQGARTAQSGPTAIRGTLTQDLTPRSALMTLASATDTNNKWY